MSKTVTQVKEELRANGVTIAEWARTNGFKPEAVRSVLCGQNKGNYGTGHKVAVALGLKRGFI
jgi:gp16 family phage-associated protein